MIKNYKYRPPYKYLFVGILGLLVSLIFGYMIGKYEWWFSIISGLFCIMMLTMGILFLIIFFKKFTVGDLILNHDKIEIPGRWRKREKVFFNQIENIGEIDSYDHVIEIISSKGVHLIEKQWMKVDDFEEVRQTLIELKKKNFQ